jgi:phosphate/sulfate permease
MSFSRIDSISYGILEAVGLLFAAVVVYGIYGSGYDAAKKSIVLKKSQSTVMNWSIRPLLEGFLACVLLAFLFTSFLGKEFEYEEEEVEPIFNLVSHSHTFYPSTEQYQGVFAFWIIFMFAPFSYGYFKGKRVCITEKENKCDK